VFALVSLAMLGLGLGGVIARFAFAKHLSPRHSLGVLAGANAAAGLAILAGLVVVLRIADRPWIGEPAGMLIVLGILLVPLVCAGVAFAQLFRSFGAISGRVYGADLAGAAAGCLGVIWALDQFGGVGSLLLVAVLAAAGAVAFAWPGRCRTPARSAPPPSSSPSWGWSSPPSCRPLRSRMCLSAPTPRRKSTTPWPVPPGASSKPRAGVRSAAPIW
jgi:hypothetical protein